MLSHKIRGTWDRLAGFSRELWGELSGNEHEFSGGRRQRLIGHLETRNDLDHAEAIRRLEQPQSDPRPNDRP